MRLRLLWFFACLLLIVLIGLSSVSTTYKPNDMGTQVVARAADGVATIVVTVLFALVPSLLLALIPMKGRPYGRKFKWMLPLVICVLSVLMCVLLGYRLYLSRVRGVELRPVHVRVKLRDD